MLVSLSIRNFKSIREAHVRFGSLTCFVGHNGVGKSNLFDAIQFLSALADRQTSVAATGRRPASLGGHSPLDLVFGRDPRRSIEFRANMVTPPEIEDDFGETAKPSTTLLTYDIKLGYDGDSDRLLVERESLTYAKLGDFKRFTGFKSAHEFRESVASGVRRCGPLISTKGDRIQLHGDRGSRCRSVPVGKSLTIVGGTNTSDYPTVLAAKREMSSWRVLQLDPSAMRAPDARSAPSHVSASGAHMPSTLRALVAREPDVGAEILYRLRQLNSDIVDLEVYADEVGHQLALRARVPGVDEWLYPRSLSDGTLRYLALVLMLVDVQDRAVLCLEEPENGIHPSRVPNLAELLRDYAVDLDGPVALDNSLRQVAINSHSPEIARQLSFGDIVFVERAATRDEGSVSVFRPVAGEWRSKPGNGDVASLPVGRQAVVDFIGGSPLSREFEQFEPAFGSAR